MPNLPETEAEAISWKKVHLTMDQWKNIHAELGLEKSVKSADVSLDNLVTGKRRSKPVTPVKSQTKKRAKKGGKNLLLFKKSFPIKSPANQCTLF